MSHRYQQRQTGELNGESKHVDNKINDVKEIDIKKENVKTERLSPMSMTTTTTTTTTTSAISSMTTSTTNTSVANNANAAAAAVAAAAHGDNNSNSSRSGTPSSSYPGTPPGCIADSREHGSSPLNTSSSHGQSGSHLKQMEQMMMSRNYSDFMRSLAAKYNNANPNEYVSNVFYVKGFEFERWRRRWWWWW